MDELSAAQVIDRLAITYRDLRKLASCGVLRGRKRGTATAYPAQYVHELASRAELQPGREAIAVRLGPPSEITDPTWPDRKLIGWHEDWDESTKRNAVRGWWRIAHDLRAPGTPMVALVGPIIVGAWTVTGDDTPELMPGGLRRLTLKSPDDRAQRYLNKIVRLGPGAMVTRI